MRKQITERDILDELRAGQLPERSPGWMTYAEMCAATGGHYNTIARKVAAMIAAGKAEKMQAMVRNARGQRVAAWVYRLKK